MPSYPSKPIPPLFKGGMTPQECETWTRAYEWAYTSILGALLRVQAYKPPQQYKDYSDWFEASPGNGWEGRLKTVNASLTSMVERMSSIAITILKSTDDIKCKRQGFIEKLFQQRDAYVEILQGDFPGDKAISLCVNAFDDDHLRLSYQDSAEWARAFILVHEMHHAAADTKHTILIADSHYSRIGCGTLPFSDPGLAVKNAQNYAYFVMGTYWVRPVPEPGWKPDYGIWSERTVESGWGRAADSPAAAAILNELMVAYREPEAQGARLMVRVLKIIDKKEVWLDPMPFQFLRTDGHKQEGGSVVAPALAAWGPEAYCVFIDKESKNLVFVAGKFSGYMQSSDYATLYWGGASAVPDLIAADPLLREGNAPSPSAAIAVYRPGTAPNGAVNQSAGLYCVYVDKQHKLRCAVRLDGMAFGGGWKPLLFDQPRGTDMTPTLVVHNGQLKCIYRSSSEAKFVVLAYEPVMKRPQFGDPQVGVWKEDSSIAAPTLDAETLAVGSWNTANGAVLVAVGNKAEIRDGSLRYALCAETRTWSKDIRLGTVVSPNRPALVEYGSSMYLFYRSADGSIHSRAARPPK
jgi:hypothetical protein